MSARHRFVLPCLALAAVVSGSTLQAAELPTSKFYAYCIELGVKDLKPRPLAEQAALLGNLGFDGTGLPLDLTDELDSQLKLLDGAQLQAFLFWTSVNVNPAKPPAYDPRLPGAIRKLKGRPATVCVLLTGLKPGEPQGIDPAVKALRELGDCAKEAGVRISVYNHVHNWTERVPFAVEIVQKTAHPQVGYNFNLCHWLKVEGAKDYRPLLRQNASKLFCVTINGAQIGAPAWTDGLIQPLDKGDFDNRTLLGTLREIGFTGPVGLMCYGVPGDPADFLARSMKVWKSWHNGN